MSTNNTTTTRREILPVESLRILADAIGRQDEIRVKECQDEWGSPYIHRAPTAAESAALASVAFSALLAINWADRDEDRDRAQRQAFKDGAESAIDQLIPGINGYDSMYCPLWALIDSWPLRRESDAAPTVSLLKIA